MRVFVLAVSVVCVVAGCPGRPASLAPTTDDDAVSDAGPGGLDDDVIEEPDAPATLVSVPFVGGSGFDHVTSAAVIEDEGGEGNIVVLAGSFENTGDVRVGEGPGAIEVVVPGNRDRFGFVAGFDLAGTPLWVVVVDGTIQIFDDGVVEVSGTWDQGGPDERRVGEGFLARVGPDGKLLWGHALQLGMHVTRAALVDDLVTVIGKSVDGTIVARADVATGALLWMQVIITVQDAVGLGGFDAAGRPYVIVNTAEEVDLADGPLVADIAGDAPRAIVVAFHDDGRVRWVYTDAPAPAEGSSQLFQLAQGQDGVLVAVGTARQTEPLLELAAGRAPHQASASRILRLRQEDGSVVDEQTDPGPALATDLVVGRDRTWLAGWLRESSLAEWNDGRARTAMRGGLDQVLVELDRQARPRRVLPLSTDRDDSLKLVGRDDVVVAHPLTPSPPGAPLWLAQNGARVELPAGDARALVFRASDDDDPTPAPPPAAPPPHATSPLLRTVGGSGFDAGKDVALLRDGSVLATGRFTPTGDVRATGPGGELLVDGPPGWSMGHLVRFDDDGAPRWVLTVGAPFGLGGAFPIAAMAASPDGFSVFIAGNAGAGGGGFDLGRAGGIPLDGGFLAHLDGRDGSLRWLVPLDPLIDVESLALTPDGVAVASRRPYEGSGSVRAEVAVFSADTGALRWSRRVDGVTGGGVVVTDEAGKVFFLARLGVPGSVLVDGVVADSGSGRDAVALAFDADGALRWSHVLAATGRSEVPAAGVAFGGRLLVCGPSAASTSAARLEGESRIVSISSETGQVLEDTLRGPRGCTGIALDEDTATLVVADRGADQNVKTLREAGWEPKGFSDVVIGTFDLEVKAVRAQALGGRGHEEPAGLAVHDGRFAVTGRFLDALTLDDGTRVRPVRGDALVLLGDTLVP